MYESESIEFKEVYAPELKREVVAFTNTNGGTIYIGVQDNGEISGLENLDFVMQQISNAVRVSIAQMFRCLQISKNTKCNNHSNYNGYCTFYYLMSDVKSMSLHDNLNPYFHSNFIFNYLYLKAKLKLLTHNAII